MSDRRAANDGPWRVMIDRGGSGWSRPLEITVRAGWARLRPRAIGICGSNLHVLAGQHPFVAYPVAPGHEIVAGVTAARSRTSRTASPAGGSAPKVLLVP